MRWAFSALALLTGFGAAIQVPHLNSPLNAVVFAILVVQFVAYTAVAVVSWIEEG